MFENNPFSINAQSNIFSLLLNDTFQDRINIQSHHLGTFKEKATRISSVATVEFHIRSFHLTGENFPH